MAQRLKPLICKNEDWNLDMLCPYKSSVQCVTVTSPLRDGNE